MSLSSRRGTVPRFPATTASGSPTHTGPSSQRSSQRATGTALVGRASKTTDARSRSASLPVRVRSPEFRALSASTGRGKSIPRARGLRADTDGRHLFLPTVRVYLCRHAKAAPGEPDELRPLTPEGVDQAQRLGERLAEEPMPPAVVLSSPLLRARQTAEAIAHADGGGASRRRPPRPRCDGGEHSCGRCGLHDHPSRRSVISRTAPRSRSLSPGAIPGSSRGMAAIGRTRLDESH